MEDLQKLIDQQLKLEKNIQQLWTNFNKDSPDRKTSGQYFEKRLESLEQIWIEFQSNNEEIEKRRFHNKTHEYFTKKYFGQIENKYGEIQMTLRAEMRRVQGAMAKAEAERLQKSAELQKSANQQDTIRSQSAVKSDHFERPASSHSGAGERTNDVASNVGIEVVTVNQSNTTSSPAAIRMGRLKKSFIRTVEGVNFNERASILKFKLNQLKEYWSKIEALNEDSLDAIDNDEFFDMQSVYQDAYIGIQEALDASIYAETKPRQVVKLPAITLPVFNGRYDEWTTFWELFERLVHQNEDLSNVEKMQYLKSNVRGEAARIISHLSTTSGNYTTAIELVTKRFQNPAALVNSYIQKLLNLKLVRHENAFDIKNLMDASREILYGISNLGVDVTSWDALVIQLLLPKLDCETRKMYQHSRGASTEIPKLGDLFEFMEARFRGLENSKENNKEINYKNERSTSNNTKSHVTTVGKTACIICGEGHQLIYCKKFTGMKIHDRREKVRQARLCFNCLRSGHTSVECTYKKRCLQCNRKHNSLLHEDKPETTKTGENKLNAAAAPFNKTVAASTGDREQTILLATAVVNIVIKNQINSARALIDQGSQSCVMTERLAKRLKIPMMKYETQVNGINGQATQVVAKCSLRIQSIHDEKLGCHIDTIVMPKITSMLPNKGFEPKQWPHIRGLQLADPWYSESKEIDLLIGSDVFPEVLGHGLLKGPANTPMAQNTIFGWILSGPVVTKAVTKVSNILVNEVASYVSVSSEDEVLRKFWELEEIPTADLSTNEEKECENHYKTTHTRDEAGRYIVKLPLHQERSCLGDSKRMALKRFYSLELRLARNPKLRNEYIKFIREYLRLGHMEEATTATSGKTYYLPHHAVIKEDSTTTKLRVVFDASAKTTSGESLNSIMMIGPTIQKDLLLLLLQWRTFPIVFTADIEKMYRQILVHQDDRDLQRILWREHSNDPIKEYTLNTVTYGTASAPYLAVKTLVQLSEDEKINYPTACETLANRFYVDDCLGGAETVKEGKRLQKELIEVLQKGGLKLRKWTSNHPELLQSLPKEDVEMQLDMDFDNNETVKILGIKWCPKTDEFNFKINTGFFSTKNTKRSILSDAGKLFDPFGWLAPITIKAKIMIQKLWLRGIDWDQEVPTDLKAEWQEFKSRLSAIHQLRIPRWIQQSKTSKIELHGFADASQMAYAAVVYAKVTNEDGVKISLIASKTKVAPVKQVQLAKLELCAVMLLTKLISYVKKGSEFGYDKVVIWSDSKIVLGWLKQHPVRWTTFVANRVAYVQEHFTGQIRFIPGKENPADIPSRGSFGDSLLNNSLWWNGPQWLAESEDKWPADEETASELPEARKTVICSVVHEVDELLSRFSSLNKLYRVTAYCLRFITNARKDKPSRNTGCLTIDEIKAAERSMVRRAQLAFEGDIRDLKHKKLKKSSPIYRLNPFIDLNGILRVAGRMDHTNLSTNQKHPMILSNSCSLTRLIINQSHLDTMHGGVKLTLNHTRNKFWIIRGTQTIKSHINKCVKCFRFKTKGRDQLMGQLPEPRVNFSRPFTHCGIDYAGPLHIRCSKTRGVKSHKAYIAIFVCLATKAIHIELTSDLTTEGFLAALKRMISRRGAVHHIYSDNGTNFVGANNLLQKIQMKNDLSERGIRWHFIPPGSPHFGGLWESAVKSVKYHLNRVIGEQKLTYEEMNTILVQIEGCLNSRPICALSDNVEDLDALTPGHFIVGSAIIMPTHDSVINMEDSSLKRWKIMQKIKQDICNRWYQDYIKAIQQQRYKWQTQTKNLRPGQLVLMKDEALYPTSWPLGRVLEVHKGSDGLVRVATIKTQKGSVKRSIQKICLLPTEDTINHVQNNKNRSSNATEAINADAMRQPGRNLKDKGSNIKTLSMIMLLCLLSSPRDVEAKYTITHPSAGLFVESLGTAKVQRGILRITSEFPIADFNTDKIQLNKTKDKMSYLCDRAKELTQDTQCNELIHHLNEEWTNIYDVFNRFNLIPRRQKRGILGTVMTSLFGVNDEAYHDIEALDQNQKELIKNAKTSTKIMLSTIAAVNETEARINAKITNFTNKLNEGIQAINDMEKWYQLIDENKINIHILNAYLVASSYMKEIEYKYSKLLNAYLKRSHLYEFVTHQKIQEVTTNCTKILGPSLEVLAKPLDKLDVIVTSTQFTVAGYLLITDTEEYELLNINTVPEKVDDNMFQEALITTSIVGVNFNLERYFESSVLNIKLAEKWNETTIILQPAIFLEIDSSGNCIVQQLYKKLSFEKCTARRFSLNNTVWKELWTKNAWLFVTPIQTTVYVTCGTEREEVFLNETGIIHITPNCVIQSKYVRLEAQLAEEVSLVTHYTKTIVMINTTINALAPVQIMNETVIPLMSDLANVLKVNEREATEVFNNLHENNWKAIWKHQYWTNTIVSIVAILIILCGLAIAIRVRYCRKGLPGLTRSNNIELRDVKGNDNSAFEVNW